jgi:hypothetical protein
MPTRAGKNMGGGLAKINVRTGLHIYLGYMPARSGEIISLANLTVSSYCMYLYLLVRILLRYVHTSPYMEVVLATASTTAGGRSFLRWH